ncbi:MAG: Rieske 2Fe-2S domain-containing protein [Chloroflexi bacterium]|nr:Rieske 2Fe-2S domain-containing protein [Chloroflexota bacterium]
MTVSANVEKKPVTRREFLNIAWLASLGFLSVNLGGVTYLFSMPRFKAGEFGGVFTAGKVSELPAVGAAPANYPKVKLWLSNTPEGVTALYKVCTHLGCLYNWNSQEGKFICPCHGSQFQASGEYIRGPAPRSLDRFVLQAVDPASGAVLAESTDGSPMSIPEGNPNAEIRVDTGKRIQGERHA